MVSNFMCDNCISSPVCKVKDILEKFSDDVKKPLGVDIDMEACENFKPESDEE